MYPVHIARLRSKSAASDHTVPKLPLATGAFGSGTSQIEACINRRGRMWVHPLVYSVLRPRYWFIFRELRRVFDSPRLHHKNIIISIGYVCLSSFTGATQSRFRLVDGVKLLAAHWLQRACVSSPRTIFRTWAAVTGGSVLPTCFASALLMSVRYPLPARSDSVLNFSKITSSR